MFTKKSATIPEFEKASESSIRTFSFTADKIKKKLKLLNPYKLTGVDELHPKVLKELLENLSLSFSITFDKSFKEVELPRHWKDVIITLLNKIGQKELGSNYQPISLTYMTCKVMQSIINDNIL